MADEVKAKQQKIYISEKKAEVDKFKETCNVSYKIKHEQILEVFYLFIFITN